MWKTFLWVNVGKSGANTYFYINFNRCSVTMGQLTGEFECKLDAKGRMVLPAALKRQLPDVERLGLVVNRGFEKHLVIYTQGEWSKITNKLAKLNRYKVKNRQFIRRFTRGHTELSLDSANRILLPKSLLEYAGIQGELVLLCQFDQIEVWSKEAYNKLWDDEEDDDFAALAEDVMGDYDIEEGEDD